MLRLHFGGRVALLFQHAEQPRVERYAFGLEQALICRVADQCMLEEIGRVRRRAAAEDQFGRQQSLQCVGQLAFGQSLPVRRSSR